MISCLLIISLFTPFQESLIADTTNPSSDVLTDSLLNVGNLAEKEGNYEKALHIWSSILDKETAKTNPEVGIEYIQLATDQKLKNYYIKASEMYYQGLSECANTDKKQFIQK